MKTLKRRIYIGNMILIGIDPIMCGHNYIIIPGNLLSFLHKSGIFSWHKLIFSWHGSTPVWKDAKELCMSDELGVVWKTITDYFGYHGLRCFGMMDHLSWSVPNSQLPVRVRDILGHDSLQDLSYT